jgi:nucleoside-diphosphate-sugar epimerase
MTTLAALGFGYCARHLVALHPGAFSRVIGTARTPEKARAMPAGVEGFVFDGQTLSPDLAAALARADVLVASAPPDETGDPVLRIAGPALAAGRLSQVVYLTTLGVYGNHDGAWVDEATVPRPADARLVRRLEAEAAWFDFGRQTGIPVAALRLAGIYGPGRNALVQVRAGEARAIARPGQVFNRIHVDDIASAILAVAERRFSGILNVTDDEPAASCDPILHAAALLGLPAPEVVPFAEAAKTMSPMALSFWGNNKRVSNARLKSALGVALAHPTYREGLAALRAAGEGAA